MKTKHIFTIVTVLFLSTLSWAADSHSYAQPDLIQIKHLDLDLNVDLDKKTLAGTAILTLDRKNLDASLILDTQDLKIESIQTKGLGRKWEDVNYMLGVADPILGQKLEITIPKEKSVRLVKIVYAATDKAQGLQWNTPEQTSSKRPFMLTNNQPIAGRSWIPCQDTPVVRMTYSARIHVAQTDLMAVMSAKNPTRVNSKGNYSFNMDIPVPSYLVALAVGKLEFIPTGNRTGVYAEPSVVKQAASEFADAEKMLEAAESLYGKYAWGRYDLLILPASYPWGGMENPRLTFVSPALITGKKDLVDVVAHEIAHSWSGNLVTNAGWNDVWINEGFTTYVQYRIIEQLHGTAVRMRDMALDFAGLTNYLHEKDTKAEDTRLHPDFQGRDPADAFTDVPYVKGAFLLYAIENQVGKAKFDEFLKNYFKRHTFQSIDTHQVMAEFSQIVTKDFLDQWINRANLPATVPPMNSTMVTEVNKMVEDFKTRKMVPEPAAIAKMTSKDFCYFLESLPKGLTMKQLQTLDQAFHFSSTVDPEVMTRWYELSLPKNYELTMQTAPTFVTKFGRGKYVRPIYKALIQTPRGRAIAVSTYEKNRNFYSPMTRGQIEKILNEKK